MKGATTYIQKGGDGEQSKTDQINRSKQAFTGISLKEYTIFQVIQPKLQIMCLDQATNDGNG